MKLYASTCKKIARDSLKGHWGQAIFMSFKASLLGTFTNLFTAIIKLPILVAIIIILFEQVPFYRQLAGIGAFIIAIIWLYVGSFARLGYLNFNLALLDRRGDEQYHLIQASSGWWDSVEARLIAMIRTLVGMLFILIPGIITAYNCALVPFILEESNNDISVREAFAISKEKMKGHRWEYFSLRISFFWWKLLGILTLGIAYLWINPYYYLAEAVFFNEISGRAEALYGRE